MGRLASVTVTVAIAVAVPTAFAAVSVYVVVADGLKDIEPVAEVEAKLPGVMVMLVAAEVAQLSVVLVPAVILAGLAEKDAMVAAEVCVRALVDVSQPTGPPHATRSRAKPQRPLFSRTNPSSPSHFPEFDKAEPMRNPSAGMIESPAQTSVESIPLRKSAWNSPSRLPSAPTSKKGKARQSEPGNPTLKTGVPADDSRSLPAGHRGSLHTRCRDFLPLSTLPAEIGFGYMPKVMAA